jgi:hypothetical protein
MSSACRARLEGVFWLVVQPKLALNGKPMNPKLLILLAWVFYLLDRRTSDDIWYFCMIYSCVLAACAFFYTKDARNRHTGKKSEKGA